MVSQVPNSIRTPFHALGGPNEIQLFGLDHDRAERVTDALIAEVARIEAKYSRYQDQSVISRINTAAGGDPIRLDDETSALVDYAAACYAQSDGLFDITSGVLRRAWNFRSEQLPTQDQIAQVLPLVGWARVEWERPYIRLPSAGMEIDFGGFGKEYAVDRLIDMAVHAGVEAGLVNLGGDVRALGSGHEGRAFEVGVAHPRMLGKVLASVPLRNAALATSGDYERYFEVDGVRYCHILNPRTGWPVRSFQSVSVVAASATIAGTASTTAMLLGEKRGMRYLKDLGYAFLTVSSSGGILGSLSERALRSVQQGGEAA